MLSGFCPASFGVLFCSLVLGCRFKLLDRAVGGARFLTGGVFECDIAHRRSVAVLCMFYKIRCKAMHHLNGALPGPYVPVRGTFEALVAHRYTYAPPRCRTSQYSRTFIPLSVSLLKDLANPYSKVWDWQVSRAGPMLFYWPKMLYPFYNLLFFFPSLCQPFSITIIISIYFNFVRCWGPLWYNHIRRFSVNSRFIEKFIQY